MTILEDTKDSHMQEAPSSKGGPLTPFQPSNRPYYPSIDDSDISLPDDLGDRWQWLYLGPRRFAALRDEKYVYILDRVRAECLKVRLEQNEIARPRGFHRWKAKIWPLLSQWPELKEYLIDKGLFQDIKFKRTRRVYLSRLVAALGGCNLKRWSGRQIEVHHVDGNTENDAFENLRAITEEEHRLIPPTDAQRSFWYTKISTEQVAIGLTARTAIRQSSCPRLILGKDYIQELSPPIAAITEIAGTQRLGKETVKAESAALFNSALSLNAKALPYAAKASPRGSHLAWVRLRTQGLCARCRAPPCTSGNLD